MQKFLLAILLAIGLVGCEPSEIPSAKAQFVFVKIPEQIEPLDRGRKYEDPLDATLKKEGVGEVTGGGSQLSAPDAEGKRSIVWVGIDVELSNFSRGKAILKTELNRLGAPSTTILEYTLDGKSVEETLQ